MSSCYLPSINEHHNLDMSECSELASRIQQAPVKAIGLQHFQSVRLVAWNQPIGKHVPALLPLAALNSCSSCFGGPPLLWWVIPLSSFYTPTVQCWFGMAPCIHSFSTGLSLLSVSSLGSPILHIVNSQCWLTSLASTARFFLSSYSSLIWKHLNMAPLRRQKRIERWQRPIACRPKWKTWVHLPCYL